MSSGDTNSTTGDTGNSGTSSAPVAGGTDDAMLAAAMVVDSVGSTSRRAALGEAAANEIDRAERAQMTTAVLAHGGSIVDFTGDGAIALFPSSSAAISAAFALCAPHYRIGIAVGEVRRDGTSWAGTPLVAATALERRCPPGAVACSALTTRTASSAPPSTSEPLPVADGTQSGDVVLRTAP